MFSIDDHDSEFRPPKKEEIVKIKVDIRGKATERDDKFMASQAS
jgi:hypothetical protein